MTEHNVYTDEGAKQQLDVIATEQQLPNVVRLAMKSVYEMERKEGQSPEMAYTRTVLRMCSSDAVRQRAQQKYAFEILKSLQNMKDITASWPSETEVDNTTLLEVDAQETSKSKRRLRNVPAWIAIIGFYLMLALLGLLGLHLTTFP